MKLNSLISAALACMMAVMSAGCSDWLDYTPKDKQSYEQQFSTVGGFHSAVNGIYNSMSGGSLYGRNLSYGAMDVLGLLYNVPEKNKNRYELLAATHTGDYAQSVYTNIWSSAYNTILNINLVLQALDEFPQVLAKDDATLIRGEMLGLRAYLHLDLVRLFGPSFPREPEALSVPFADSPEVVKRPRLSAREIITQKIIPDLEQAQTLLAEVDPVITEGVMAGAGDSSDETWWRYRQLRLNYYAVTLLKARAYTWMEDWPNALAEAEKLMDPAVDNIFPWVEPNRLLSNNVNPDRVFSTECLFGYYTKDLENIYTYYFTGTLDTSDMLQPRNGYVSTLFSNTADYRRQSQWAVSASVGGAEFDFVKYRGFKADTESPEFWASFFGLMRRSEAYYIAAEACTRSGQLEQGINYLNVVRQNRGIEALRTRFQTEARIMNEITLEFLREMRGEGQIYFFHKRHWQSFGQADGGYPEYDGSGLCVSRDTPALQTRYSVPIPSGENY